MKPRNAPYFIKSIQEEHQFLGLPKPKHPLISVFPMKDVKTFDDLPDMYALGFYLIAIKKDFMGGGKIKYGQRYYDYDSGVMSFMSPNQVMAHTRTAPKEGINLLFHADFLAGYPLAKNIKEYGFFSYETNEALHLSEQEETIVENIMNNIETEYLSNIDKYSQDVMIAQIELLLQYSNRFYNRQFITRKIANDEILIRLEHFLNDCFNDKNLAEKGLPSVQHTAQYLNLSPDYLSDMLRTITGQNTQQHIHNKVIAKAKELLSTTSLSVSEIAYQLGFEYAPSFNKLFKSKTNLSPSAFRQSFN